MIAVRVTGDTDVEGDEQLTLSIAGVSLGSVGAASTHTVTILDDD